MAKLKADRIEKPKPDEAEYAHGACVCGAVRFEMQVPAVWAWHDHSKASRHAQGCAYATYVGSWRKRFRITHGETQLRRYEDPEAKTARSFCGVCGTPVLYERARSPRNHTSLDQAADWEYRGEALAPLKGYPGVMWERPRKRKRGVVGAMFE